MGVQERKAREKEELRQEILDAARDLFVREGIQSVSMRRIADQVEYSPGTIYLYFKDKAEIVRTLCDETFFKLDQRLRAIKEDASDPLGSLRRGLRTYIEFGLQNPHHYLVTFVLPRGLPGETERDAPIESGRCCFENLRGIVRKCIDQGLFRIRDVEEASQVLWAGIHGITSLLIARQAFPFIEKTRLVESLVDVLVEGVRRR
jgi:AcrR family transcriptional regulator